MTSFAPQAKVPSASLPDPRKHVNYTLGMVLGVDDFTQEFAYLSGRDQWLARDLLGYGTVCGLRVTIEGQEVVVTPGAAVSPLGQLMRVTPVQCADLNKWLAIETNKQQLIAQLGAPPLGTVMLYVVLCYRDCPTEMVPIPGEPCRSEEETMAPSRRVDDFKLELRFTPPGQCEEDALRTFVAWLSQHVQITDTPGSFTPLDDFLETIRTAAQPLTSPPCSPPTFMFDSPLTSLRIHSADACAYLRAAFRLWVTELRPRWRPRFWEQGHGCAGDPSVHDEPEAEECVLLAELHVPLTADGQVADFGKVVVDEEHRPYLVHLRMLQEWVLCGRPGQALGVGAARTFATLFVKDPQTIRAWIHHPQPLSVLTGEVTIEVNDAPLSSPPQLTTVSQPFPGVNVFDLHLDAPLADDSRVTVRFDADSITEETSLARRLSAALDEIDYAYLDREGHTLLAYLAVGFPALDDLADVNAPTPQDGQVLTRQGGRWVAAPPAGGVTAHGLLSGLGEDDHSQYLLANGTRALTGNLNAGNRRITNLAAGANPGDAVRFQQAIKQNDPTDPTIGDLSGPYPNPTVARLRGKDIAPTPPTTTNQVLTWNQVTNQWEPRLHALDDLTDVNTPTPQDGQVLTRQGGQWVAAPPAGGVTDHGLLTGLREDHHPQYLLVNLETRALIANLNAGTNRVTNLSPGANPGDAVIFQQAIKVGDKAGGDLLTTSSYPGPTVAGLQGRPVPNVAPNENEVLTWHDAAWVPRPVPPLLPFVSIVRLDNGMFELWFNIDAPDNNFDIPSLNRDEFEVWEETATASPTPPNFLARINVTAGPTRSTRNLFRVTLERESELLRFRFYIDRMQVTGGQRVIDYIVPRGIKFMGHDGSNTVTAFVRGRRG